jgi:Arc/MetJ-type ribon-helix-helix transcriptional regulator
MMTAYDDGMRTIVELPEDQLTALDAWRSVRGISRAEAIRRAVASLLASEGARRDALIATKGLWAGRDEDGLVYQERLRDEWGDR